MDISTLTDNEKTVMLAKLMGWREFSPGVFLHPDIHKRFSFFSNLYDEEKMALAWLVLNWAMTAFSKIPRKGSHYDLDTVLLMYLEDIYLYEKPPAEAQATWLDKILQLAIEAGMVEVEK